MRNRPRREEYEQTLLEEVRRTLDPSNWVRQERDSNGYWVTLPMGNVFGEGIDVAEVRLDIVGADHALVVLIRDLARPECLFGFQFRAVEVWGQPQEELLDPKTYATVIWANVDEEIHAIGYGLPKDCSSDDITWVYRI
jgi:hypothetical protein